MSKFIGTIVGGIEIAIGAVLVATGVGAPIGALLISAGVGTVLSGLGTLLSGSGGTNQAGVGGGGLATASRNPIASWLVVAGRAVVGGTIVHLHEFGADNKYLDMVLVLAAHQCESVDALMFDKQMVQLEDHGDGTYDSFEPVQQTVNIVRISRAKDVVTVTVDAAIPLAQPGDKLFIQGISADVTLMGKYPVGQVSVDHKTFTYICGGAATTIDFEGTVTTLWPDYGRKIHMEVLLGTQTETFPGMIYGTPNDGDTSDLIVAPNNPWTTDQHKLLGKTCVFLRLHYDDRVFAGGLPQISFLMKGKNDIFDPRTSTYGYTENAALWIADYLAHPTWGFKAAYGTGIPTAELIAAANICDEDVLLAIVSSPASYEKRYTINGKFDLSVKRGEVLQNLLTACAGRITHQGGQFRIWPAAWLGASPVTAPGIGDMNGPLRWKPTVSSRDLYNGVKGTYVSPANNWQASDIPPYAQDEIHGYTSDANLIADGGERRWLDIQLPFTISAAAAQRICKIELLRRRQQGTGTFRYNMAGYAISTMDVVALDISYFGWTGKLFEVLSHRFTLDKISQDGTEVTLLGTEIDVQETDSSVYDWEDTEELTPQGYQQPALPDPTKPAPPTGLTLLSDVTTTVVTPAGLADSIHVTWDAPVDGYVLAGGHIEIRYRELVPYSEGTVAVTNGSANVTGTGTSFVIAMVGGDFILNGATYTVKSVTSPTALVLTAVFAAATAASMPFSILYSTAWKGLPSVNPTVTEVVINGVTDGNQYYVQARSVNAGGVPSQWVSAGPVTADGARAPLPWRPFGELVFSAPFRAGMNLAQRGNFVDISGYQPVNRLSETLTAPVADANAVVSAHTGNALPVGDFIAQVFGIDSAGLYSPGSGFIRFPITDPQSRVSFAVNFPAGTVQAEMFIGRDPNHLISQPIILSPTSGNQTLDSISYLSGYGPPDTRSVAFHVVASRETHGGIFIATVTAADASSVTISIPAPLTVNALAGRTLSLMSKFGLPDTQTGVDLDITANDATGVLTASNPGGSAIDVGDLVMVRMLSTAATGTTIQDTGWLSSPFAPTGLVTDQDKDKRLIILHDPTGAAQTGDTVTVLSNTADTHTVTPFPRVPGNGTSYIIVEPAEIVDVKTKPFDNAIRPGDAAIPVIASVPASDLAGYVALFRVKTRDANGGDSINDGDGLREMYIIPQATGSSGPIVDVTAGADGSFTPDLALGISFRCLLTADAPVNLPINAPASALTDWSLELDQDSTGKHSAILDPGYNCKYALSSDQSKAGTRCVAQFTTDDAGKTYPNSAPTVDQPIPA